MVWTKTFGLKFKTFSSQVTRIWGMRMEVWLWCRCECWVWWMAQVSANVMEIQQYNGNMNNKPGMFYSDPLQISIVKWLLDNNWTLPVGRAGRCVQCPVSSRCLPVTGSISRDQINSKMRQRRHLQSKAMGRQIWNWTEECLWAACLLRKQLLS